MTPRLSIHADPPLSLAAERIVKELVGDALVTKDPNCVLNMTLCGTNYRGKVIGFSFQPKFVMTFHPTQAFKRSDWMALLKYDIARAVQEAGFPEIRRRTRDINRDVDKDTIIRRLQQVQVSNTRIGFDLEGSRDVRDCSIADSETTAIWIPFEDMHHQHWWSERDGEEVWQTLKEVLEDPDVPKVCHNALHELFVLSSCGIEMKGLMDDSMLLWHEFEPELDKDLSVVASVLTDQPYWGTHEDHRNEEERAIYNCTDSMMTLECANRLIDRLDTLQLEHYRQNITLVEAAAWQHRHGFGFDVKGRNAMKKELEELLK